MKESIKQSLKNKKILLSTCGCNYIEHFECRDWIPILKNIFGKVTVFGMRNHYYHHGKDYMNKLFLETIKKEKPDYIWINFDYDEIKIDTLIRIKEICPNCKTIFNCGDDDFRYDDFSRYYALFFDYVVSNLKDLSVYTQDGIKNVFYMVAISPKSFKPLNTEKKYPVSFIGAPVADRYDYIKYLKENHVDISLFGFGWNDFPDLKAIYKGHLLQEDFVKVVNETKINLNFSKSFLKKKSEQMKNRVLEVPACKSFILTEYTKKNPDFINKFKEINFRNKEELLKKINYFLKNENEIKKITNKVYKETLKEWTWELQLINFFNNIEKNKNYYPKRIFKKYKIKRLKEEDLLLENEKIIRLLKNYDYVTIKKDLVFESKYRDFIQGYSLEKSKKEISCCDYTLSSPLIGDYAIFLGKKAYNLVNNNDFNKLLNINQLAVKKEFFINHLSDFKKIIDNKFSEIITEDNTVFVSIPLVSIRDIDPIGYIGMKKVFRMLFFNKLFSIVYNKKPSVYPLKMIIESLKRRKYFIIRYIFDYISNKENWKKLNFF